MILFEADDCLNRPDSPDFDSENTILAEIIGAR